MSYHNHGWLIYYLEAVDIFEELKGVLILFFTIKIYTNERVRPGLERIWGALEPIYENERLSWNSLDLGIVCELVVEINVTSVRLL